MGQEIDLLKNYPKTKRNLSERSAQKTDHDREIARKFDREFFDGERKHGYGGFSYNPRFWQPVIPDLIAQYGLNETSEVLDIGCAKGFMLHDLKEQVPDIKIAGVDISAYAIENCIESVRQNLQVANATKLPFPDNSFDLVIAINTIHNLELPELILSLREINRVTRKDAFVTVDAYRNNNEKEAMFAWNLTAKTILSTTEWKKVFQEAEYEGDYYWFIP